MTTQDPFCTVVNCISLKAAPEMHINHISLAVSSLINEHNDVLLISSCGDSVSASRSLLCLSSPVLGDLLAQIPCCAKPTILLPDFSTQAIKHLISVVSNGFTTSHLGHGVFKDINQVIDLSRLFSIADLSHLSYEKSSVDFENEGTSDVDSNCITVADSNQIDVKVEPVDVGHEVPIIVSCKSLQTGEDLFYSGQIIESLDQSFTSSSKNENIDEERVSVSGSERSITVQTPPAKVGGVERRILAERESDKTSVLLFPKQRGTLTLYAPCFDGRASAAAQTNSTDTKRCTENSSRVERSIGSQISVTKEKQRSPVRFPGCEEALVKAVKHSTNENIHSHRGNLSRNSNASNGNNMDNSRWSCDECDIGFLTRDLLREHRRIAKCKIGVKKQPSKKYVSECVDFNENIKRPDTLSSSVNKQGHKKCEGSRGKVTKNNNIKVQTLEQTKKAGKLYVETATREMNSKRRKSLTLGSDANDQKEILSTANVKGHQKCEESEGEVIKRSTAVNILKPTKATGGGEITKRSTAVDILKPTKATEGGELTKRSTTVDILKHTRVKASLDVKLKPKTASNVLRSDRQKEESKSTISSRGERYKSGSRVTSGNGGRSKDGRKSDHRRSREGSEKRSPKERSSTTPGGRRRPRTRTLSRSRGEESEKRSPRGEKRSRRERASTIPGGRRRPRTRTVSRSRGEGSEKRSSRERASTTPGGRRPRTRTVSRSGGSSRYRSRSKLRERSRERSRLSYREESKISHSKGLGKKSSKIKEDETRTVDKNGSLEALERMRDHVRSKIFALEVEEGEIVEVEN